MGAFFSSAKREELSLKPRMTCELDPNVIQSTRIHDGYYFDHKLYLITENPHSQQVIVVNLFTGQRRSLAIINLPDRSWMYRFMLLQRKHDGTLLGIVELCSHSDDSRYSRESNGTIYYYSVLLSQAECRILKLIWQFREDEKDVVCPDLTSRFRLIYRQRRPDFYSFTIYELSIDYDKPEIKKLSTFEHPDELGKISTSGRYVTAYSHLLAKEKGSLYIRNLMTGKWNWLEPPFPIERNCLLIRLDDHGETAKYTCVVGLSNSRNMHLYRVITLEMDTNELHVFAEKKLEFYGTEGIYFKAADDNIILSFNRTYMFGPDPNRPRMRLFRTGPFLIHQFPTQRPQKLTVMTFLASRNFVATSQIKLPESFPIQLDGELSQSAFQNMFEPQSFQIPKPPQETFFHPGI